MKGGKAMDIYVVLLDYDQDYSEYICTGVTLEDAQEEVRKRDEGSVHSINEPISEWKKVLNQPVWVLRYDGYQYRIIKDVLMT